MTHLHEKSPCCQGLVRRFGGRRRQCVVCKKTWSVWQRKQGRKRRRISPSLLFQYFAGKYIPSTPTERARLRIALKKYNDTVSWSDIPDDPLIAVADGMIEYIDKEVHTIYFILLRPLNGIKAIIIEPFCLPGQETPDGWKQAFAHLVPRVREQIVAIVCDGHRAFAGLSDQYGWIVQRCHFHLFARIGHNASFRSATTRTGLLGRIILRLARIVTTTRDPNALQEALKELEFHKCTVRSRTFKTVLSGFLHNYEDYRTYLDYPLLYLPTTSNSAEHLIGCLRRMQYKARGFSSLPALLAWIKGWCKHQKTITCRGKNQQH